MQQVHAGEGMVAIKSILMGKRKMCLRQKTSLIATKMSGKGTLAEFERSTGRSSKRSSTSNKSHFEAKTS